MTRKYKQKKDTKQTNLHLNLSLGITKTCKTKRPLRLRDKYKILKNPSCLTTDIYSKGAVYHRWVIDTISVLPIINILHGKEIDLNFLSFTELVIKSLHFYGENRTLAMLKEYRVALQQFILEQKVTRIKFCKSDRDNFPNPIKFLKPSDRNLLNDTRYAVSLMRIIDLFKMVPNKRTSSITSPSTADQETIHDIIQFIKTRKWLKTIEIDYEVDLPLSNHAGPNGPATATCEKDLKALLRPENEVLADAISIQLQYHNSPVNLDDQYDELPKGDNYRHSKLVFLSDKAGKTRQVAIADWWSNAALSVIHKTFMAALKRIRADLTYRQDEVPTVISELGTNLFSSDMKDFTNRFPRELEVAIVEAVFDKDTADRWNTIISDRKFYVHKHKYVKYKVGNPMGLLSSWAVSTVAHHIVKQYCAHIMGRKKGYKYVILGDDTIDTEARVYDAYLKTIKKLGVEISTSKCTVSSTGSVEFAKRLFYKQTEVTGLPVYLLKDIHRYPEHFLELLRLCRQRGYKDSTLGPCFKDYISIQPRKVRLITSDLLTLPVNLLGQDPLYVSEDLSFKSYAYACINMCEADQLLYLRIARDTIFWSEVNKVDDLVPLKPDQEGIIAKPSDYLCLSIYDKLLSYSMRDTIDSTSDIYNPEIGGESYSIYDSWVEGEYRSLLNLPMIDTYLFRNKGHKVNRCKYLVLKKLLELVDTDNTHYFVTPIKRLSNMDLYRIALKRNGKYADSLLSECLQQEKDTFDFSLLPDL